MAVQFPAEADAQSLVLITQTGNGAHPASFLMGTGDFLSTVKCAGPETAH